MTRLRLIVLSFLVPLTLQSTSLRDSIEDTLNNNPSIIASHINRDAYLKYVEQEEGDYLPTLDLDAYLEKSRTYNKPDTSPPARGWSNENGWNVALKLAYVLYDGGLTPAEVAQFQHQYNANRFKSMYDIEEIILDTVNAYVDLVGSQELLSLAEDNIKIHEKYLEVAKEKEEISGEVLETYQVNSKYHSVLDKYYKEQKEEFESKNLFKKLVGKELSGDICRPVIDESYIPTSVKEAVELGLRRSLKINEQVEKIKEQRELLAGEKAAFLPTVTFELQGTWDNDLELSENGRQDIYRGRIYLSWNLFNGGKTIAATDKEKLFLKEEQKKLDEITAEVVDEINVAYYNYYNTKKRVDNLAKYVDDNYNILMIYKKQLADGTRTFIDILNAESELYRSDVDMLDQEKDLMVAYYDLLNKLSMLSDVILMQPKQVCSKYVFTPRERETLDENTDAAVSDDLKALFSDETGNESTNEIKIEEPSLNDEDSSLQIQEENTEQIEEKVVAESVDERLDKLYKEESYETSVESTATPKPEKKIAPLEKKIQNSEKQLQEEIVVSKKDEKLLKGKYTINVATVNSEKELNRYINDFNLEEKIYFYRFGVNGKNIKLLYGSYDSVKEAKKDLSKLPKGIKEYVYIDSVKKHLKLEKKYKEFN